MTSLPDGEYFVTFRSSLGVFGGGVVTITNHQISGRDTGYVYSGSIQADGDELVGSVKATRYDKDIESVFGDIEEIELDLRGKQEGGRGVFQGALPKVPSFVLTVELERRST